MKRNKNLYLLIFLTIILICVGCGGIPAGSQPNASGEGESGSLLTASQWMQGFKEAASASIVETPYYELRRSDFRSPDIDYSAEEKKEISAYSWNARYVLTSAKGQEEERYFLSRQTSDLTAGESVEILADWQEKPHGYAVCMDIVKDDRIAVLFAEREADWKGDTLEYHLLTLNFKGELQAAQTVTKAYRELEVESYMLSLGSWWCDAEGYQYLVMGGTRLAVIDSRGELALDKEGDMAAGENLETAFHMPDGSLVFSKSITSEGRTELCWMELPAGKETTLWGCSEIGLKQFTVTPEGMLYYTRGGMLKSWNLQTGEEEYLFRFSGTGIPMGGFGSGNTNYVTVTGEGELLLNITASGLWVALADSMPKNEDDIIGVEMWWRNTYVRTYAAAFSREHEGPAIRWESYSGDHDVKWTRLSAELAAGNGPDIMIVDREQMLALQAKGVLEPLDAYLDKEILDAMYGSVREMLYIDGSIYGVLPQVRMEALITSYEVWPEDYWTVEEVLELIENREFLGLFYDITGQTSPLYNLLNLCGERIGKPFYDAQSGESHFESQEFIRLLEISKKYGEIGNKTGMDVKSLLAEGKILAAYEDIMTMMYHESFRHHYDGVLHYVGFPGQDGKVGTFFSTQYVVVNKKAKDKETIADFLKYLLQDDNQSKVEDLSVTWSAIENNIHYNPYDGEPHYMYTNKDHTVELGIKEDGTLYVTDMMEMLEHVGDEWNQFNVVWQIVEEETESYWNGTKSAEKVAEAIDNRVQLYLDERK